MKKLKLLLLSGLTVIVMLCFTACGEQKPLDVEDNQIESNESEDSMTDADKPSETLDNQETDKNKEGKDKTAYYDELIEMYVYINDIEIKLNSTTIDEYLEKSGWEDYELSDSPEEISSSVTLKDGVNEIKLVYLNENKVIFQLYTNEGFDNSLTDIKYKDSYIGTVSIGDTITNDKLNEQYIIDKEDYEFYLDGDDEETLIMINDKNREPVVLNYFYYGEQNTLSGLSLWWYIY